MRKTARPVVWEGAWARSQAPDPIGIRSKVPMTDHWRSYDSAAGVHDRVAVPHFFAPPARDLVSKVGLRPGCAVLDVGARSGVAAFLAIRESSLASRFIRQVRGAGESERFQANVAAEFRARFGDPIECTRDVLI